MSDIKELKKTLLDIRNSQFGEIPEELITTILSLQDIYAQDRSEAYKKIKKIVDEYVNSVGIE